MAILPIKTAIEDHYGNEREFVLQGAKQEHEITRLAPEHLGLGSPFAG